MNEAALGSAFVTLLRRDLLVQWRRGSELLNPVFFFVLVVTLFALGTGGEADQLRELGAGVIWVAALLAMLLSLDGLFRADLEDGVLDQLLLAPQPLALLVLAKVLAHWLASGLPLLLTSPLLALLMQLPANATGVLMLALLLGTPVLSLTGAIGAALTVGLRRGGVLVALLVLPLHVPVLIFGTQAVQASLNGLSAEGPLLLLGALLSAGLVLAPWPIAGALRLGVN